MDPEQIEKIKQFFGIEDRLDLESYKLQKEIEDNNYQGTQGTIDTDLQYHTDLQSSEINTNDFLNLSSDEEDNKINYLASKLKKEVNKKKQIKNEIKTLKKFREQLENYEATQEHQAEVQSAYTQDIKS